MEFMSPVDRIIRTLDGKPVDRVPSFCALMEERACQEVLGRPLITKEFMMTLPVTRFLLDRWGPVLTKPIVRPNIKNMMKRRIAGQAEIRGHQGTGFDAIWALYEDSFVVLDHKTIVLPTGAVFDVIPDGYGDMTWMYRGPGITSREGFEAWPHWPNPDEQAHRTYKFYKKIMARYGDSVCVCGQGPYWGLQETMSWAFGIDKLPIWIKRNPDLIQRMSDLLEELCMKNYSAMLDAGVPVILQTDDLAFKTAPLFNPKMTDKLFSDRYRRLAKYVHERGAKIIHHSCGDNTKLMDMIISWGMDGLHGYENTSNVDIYHEKKIHGDKITIIGGVGVDYLLTDQSKDEEVAEKVRELLKKLAPGGRYILSPVHSLDSVPSHKLQVMLDAVKKYGKYPISI